MAPFCRLQVRTVACACRHHLPVSCGQSALLYQRPTVAWRGRSRDAGRPGSDHGSLPVAQTHRRHPGRGGGGDVDGLFGSGWPNGRSAPAPGHQARGHERQEVALAYGGSHRCRLGRRVGSGPEQSPLVCPALRGQRRCRGGGRSAGCLTRGADWRRRGAHPPRQRHGPTPGAHATGNTPPGGELDDLQHHPRRARRARLRGDRVRHRFPSVAADETLRRKVRAWGPCPSPPPSSRSGSWVPRSCSCPRSSCPFSAR